jgi:hypothetical protein
MDTKTQIVLLVAGLLGSALKAWASNSQATLSKKSIIDVVIGGVAALLIPTFAPTMIPANATLVTQAAVIVMISYFSSSFIQNILTKLGVSADAGTPPTK